MNKKITRVLKTNMALYSLCLVAFVVAAFFVSPLLAIGEAVVVVLILLLSRRNSVSAQKSVKQYMERYTGGMDSARSSTAPRHSLRLPGIFHSGLTNISFCQEPWVSRLVSSII